MNEQTLYDHLKAEMGKEQPFEVIFTLHGENTEFEAISRIDWHDDWAGYIVFKDVRFSPGDPDYPPIQFKYLTPSAGNGIAAIHRAAQRWETLVGIFKGLVSVPSESK